MNSPGTLLGQNGLLKISFLGSIILALALSSVNASPLSTLAQQHGVGPHQGGLIEDPGQGLGLSNEPRRTKRSPQYYQAFGTKRAGAKGFHEGIFDEGFGGFTTLKKRRPEMTSRGMHGDAFTGGFGDFYTMKKRYPEQQTMEDILERLEVLHQLQEQ